MSEVAKPEQRCRAIAANHNARIRQAGRCGPRFAWLSDRALVWIFLTPTMLLLLAIAIFPLIWSLYLSFTKYSVIKDANTGPIWIGAANYDRLLDDPEVWTALRDHRRGSSCPPSPSSCCSASGWRCCSIASSTGAAS